MHDHHSHGHGHTRTVDFPTSTEGLAEARRPEVVELSDGDEFELQIAPVTKQIGGNSVRMLAYNGSIPGPTLKVRQGSEILVHVSQRGRPRSDRSLARACGSRTATTGRTRRRRRWPSARASRTSSASPTRALYWYHPHIRQDYGQEMGLYGNILVEPNEPDYWPPAHREVLLTLDDILLDEDGRVAPFSPHETDPRRHGSLRDHLPRRRRAGAVAEREAGRGRALLSDEHGQHARLQGRRGRGTDEARRRRQRPPRATRRWSRRSSSPLRARRRRRALRPSPERLTLEHRTPERTYRLAAITVEEERAEPELEGARSAARQRGHVSRAERIAPYLEAAPDKTLAFVAEMDEIGGEGVETGIYACPMHADIVATWAGKCPKCGMKLMPAPAETEPPTAFVCPMHPEITATWAGTCPKCGMTLRATGTGAAADVRARGCARLTGTTATTSTSTTAPRRRNGGHAHGAAQGIEWEDDMVEVNRMTTPANMRWMIVDRETGAENAADRLAVPRRRPGQDPARQRDGVRPSDASPVPHPRRGPLPRPRRDGVVEPNLVWKDTVLVRTGETVDILLDVTEPGSLDGALSHRRAPRERDDVQLQRRSGGRLAAWSRGERQPN